ncbi:hypothetical protein Tco_0260409 [Tanacetum coccineum]
MLHFYKKTLLDDYKKGKKITGDLNFVSFKEMITSQLQGKLWLYDEVLELKRILITLFPRSKDVPYDDGVPKPSSEDGMKVARRNPRKGKLERNDQRRKDDEDYGADADMNNLDTTIHIEIEVYVWSHLPGFEDPDFPDRVYKVEKALFTDVKTASTPMETQKPLLKDEDGEEVEVLMYRSMIGSLMCLTSSRPDIMFPVCACARYQVNPKVSHFNVVKRIFSLDRKSTTGGCQFLRCRLISWQCKKQIVVANSTTEAEYVAASSCCGQVFWIQNQLLDYGVLYELVLLFMSLKLSAIEYN